MAKEEKEKESVTIAVSPATWPATARKVSRMQNSLVMFADRQTTMPEIALTKTAKAKVMEGKVLEKEKTRAKVKVMEGKVLAKARTKTAKAAKRVANSVANQTRMVKAAKRASIPLTKLNQTGKKKTLG